MQSKKSLCCCCCCCYSAIYQVAFRQLFFGRFLTFLDVFAQLHNKEGAHTGMTRGWHGDDTGMTQGWHRANMAGDYISQSQSKFILVLFPLEDQREKNFLWGTKRKKKSSRGLRKGSFCFLWSPKGFFFHLVPQRKFFSLWSPKGKKICSWGGGPVYFFTIFLAIFFNMWKNYSNFVTF